MLKKFLCFYDTKINMYDYIKNNFDYNEITLIFLSSGTQCILELDFINSLNVKKKNIIFCDNNFDELNKKKIIDCIDKNYNVYFENDNIYSLKYLTNAEIYKNPYIISFGYELEHYENISENKTIYLQLKKFIISYNLNKNFIFSIKNNCLESFYMLIYNKWFSKIKYDIFVSMFIHIFKCYYFNNIIYNMRCILCSCSNILKNEDLIPIFELKNC